jgi:aryl-phospho-beta-D-glucosidase BglC (GH1 family)
MKKVLSVILATIVITGYSQKFTTSNGHLQLKGKQLCNQNGKPIQLKGFSTYNISFCPECITYDALKSNRDYWGANVIRAAVYDDDHWNKRNYSYEPAFNKTLIDSIVLWSEQLGLYCIIDWHILIQGNPNAKIHAGADAFFQEMSSKYAHKPHVIYEICNEPNGKSVTWDTIAIYANRIIPIIHKNSPQAIIIVGTPQWCQHLNTVKPRMLIDTVNVMYAFHFYAASHISLLPMFLKEIHRIPVFTSEWGACESSGNGNVNFNNAEQYLDAMQQHVLDGDTVSISWCIFSYSDKKEAASVLKPKSCINKLWENMTPSGFFVRDYLLKP